MTLAALLDQLLDANAEALRRAERARDRAPDLPANLRVAYLRGRRNALREVLGVERRG